MWLVSVIYYQKPRDLQKDGHKFDETGTFEDTASKGDNIITGGRKRKDEKQEEEIKKKTRKKKRRKKTRKRT